MIEPAEAAGSVTPTGAIMSDDWYYSTDRRTKVGPVSVGRLRELLRSGQLAATDLVRREGMPKWMSAGKVDELFGPPSSPANPEPQPGGEPVTHAEPDSPGAATPGSPATPVRGPSSRPHSDRPESWEDERPQAPSLADKLRANPILLAASLLFCFPLGLALVWTNKSWSKNRKIAWTGVWAALMVVCMIVVSIQEAATRRSLDEADRLWGDGHKAEAVVKYKEVIDGGVSSVEASRRPTVFQRIIEFDLEQGNTSEARAVIEKAADYGVPLAFNRDDARALYAQVRGDREAKNKSDGPSDNGWEQKGSGDDSGKLSGGGSANPSETLTQENYERISAGMTVAEVKAILGPYPANVHPLKTDPKNVGMTWVRGSRSIAVGFYDGKVRNKLKVGF